jgi:putative RNA 2'-phosphotransferase
LTIEERERLRRHHQPHPGRSAPGRTAVAVGQQYGKALVLTVAASRMHELGFKFFRAENGVWLTEAVPADFISV